MRLRECEAERARDKGAEGMRKCEAERVRVQETERLWGRETVGRRDCGAERL